MLFLLLSLVSLRSAIAAYFAQCPYKPRICTQNFINVRLNNEWQWNNAEEVYKMEQRYGWKGRKTMYYSFQDVESGAFLANRYYRIRRSRNGRVTYPAVCSNRNTDILCPLQCTGAAWKSGSGMFGRDVRVTDCSSFNLGDPADLDRSCISSKNDKLLFSGMQSVVFAEEWEARFKGKRVQFDALACDEDRPVYKYAIEENATETNYFIQYNAKAAQWYVSEEDLVFNQSDIIAYCGEKDIYDCGVCKWHVRTSDPYDDDENTVIEFFYEENMAVVRHESELEKSAAIGVIVTLVVLALLIAIGVTIFCLKKKAANKGVVEFKQADAEDLNTVQN